MGRGDTDNNQIFNRGETYSGWGDEVIDCEFLLQLNDIEEVHIWKVR